MRPMAYIPGGIVRTVTRDSSNGLAALLPCTGENRVEYGTITAKNPEMNLTRGGRTNGHNPGE
jgi:hypothetical protein